MTRAAAVVVALLSAGPMAWAEAPPVVGYPQITQVTFDASSGQLAIRGLSLVLQPGQYLLLGGPDYPGAAFDTLRRLNQWAGGVRLTNARDEVVDGIGYDSPSKPAVSPFTEGLPVMAPSAGFSVSRLPDGADTDRNLDDFSTTVPSPGAANR